MKSFYEMSRLIEQAKLEGFWKGALAGAALGAAALAPTAVGPRHASGGFAPQQQATTRPTTRPATQPTSRPTTQPLPDNVLRTQTPDVPFGPTTYPADPKAIGDYIAGHEGRQKKYYDDGKGFQTIGIGHKKTAQDGETMKKLFGKDFDYDSLEAGKSGLDDPQIDKLFGADYGEHEARAKKLLPDFDRYPNYLKAALMDGIYRGDLSGSPKTLQLINQGDWEGAAKEYLNNHEYQNAHANHMGGVAKRMEQNRDAMLRYAQEVKSHDNQDFE